MFLLISIGNCKLVLHSKNKFGQLICNETSKENNKISFAIVYFIFSYYHRNSGSNTAQTTKVILLNLLLFCSVRKEPKKYWDSNL